MNKLSYHRYFLLLLSVFVLILAGLSSISHGPKPKMDDVPLDEFSTGRALIHLSDMIGDNKPHPSGSAKNKEILHIISSKFSALGYEPQIQRTLACTTHYPGCTRVENFIAVLKGSGNGDAVMLTTHYDSVPAGPGAGDAGAGVAALIEIARILKSESQPVNDVIFLITDGEEGGLRGASGFANEHPLMKSVKLAINLEARGAAGPSTMFETHDGNRTLIKQYAQTSSHPVANSLSFEIYKRLPNDTDYSIYKSKGVAGLNYAFTGDVALYHSVRDNIAHLDKSSLQHHGNNALDAVRAFRDMDLSTLHSANNATYFDLFGKVLLNWSSSLNLPLSIIALIVMAIATYKSRIGWRQDFLDTAACLALIVLTILIGFVLSFPLGRWPSLFYLDHPYPWPGRVALMAGAGFAVWGIASVFHHKDAIGYNMLAASSAYKYDALGNIREKTVGTRDLVMTYNNTNRLTSHTDSEGPTRSLSYDIRGNVTWLGTQRFIYDYADQPRRLLGDVTGNYTYDGNLKRVKSVVTKNGITKTIYNVYDASGTLVHVDETTDGKSTDYIGKIARIKTEGGNDTTTWLHMDHLGSAQTGTDALGLVSWREQYTPYGTTLTNPLSNSDQAGFTGHIKDSATSLNYMQARYYDPLIGRFLSIDPVGFSVGQPQTFNRFSYVWNDPISANDPDGEFLNFVIGAAIGAAFETGAQLIANGGDFSKLDGGAIFKSAAVGSLTGGLGGALAKQGATKVIGGLSNKAKGNLGEAIVKSKLVLKGKNIIAQQEKAKDVAGLGNVTGRGADSVVDFAVKTKKGVTKVIDSKFTTTGRVSNTPAQRHLKGQIGNNFSNAVVHADDVATAVGRAGAVVGGAGGGAATGRCRESQSDC